MEHKTQENDPLYKLIIKYLSGKATKRESVKVLDWVNSSDENKELYFRIKDILNTVKAKRAATQPPLATWEEILIKRERSVGEITAKPRRYTLNYLKYAAAAIVILSCAALYFQHSKQNQFVIISVAENQPAKQIQLPDHSEIWLKPGSSVRYAANFNQVARVVNLNGDGFFEVAKVLDGNGRRKPFTVQTKKMSIRVLGTSFNVKNQALQYSVVVRTGVVRVESNAQVKTLHPGDRVQLLGGQLLQDKANADLYMGWTTGEYKFNNTSAKDIKDLLEANYDCTVEIVHPEKFNNIHLSGRIMAHDQKTLLNILGLMLKASISKSNNVITIKPIAYD